MRADESAQIIHEVIEMQKWLVVLFGLALFGSGVGYVYADRLDGEYTITITDETVEPAVIAVEQGDDVVVKVVNKGSKRHNLVFPGYQVYTHFLDVGEGTEHEFTASQKGDFPYYLDTLDVRESGMKGMLTVK